MKKNISINISGIIFHIEEDGYETLKRYLDSVSRYFSTFEDNAEIMADIESRMAEIFLSKLNEGKQVITAEDVASLMATMGSVSDFKAAEDTHDERHRETAGHGPQNTPYDTYGPSKQLLRDQKRKLLGGVCAGLARYINVDPVWVRLLFALFAAAYGIAILVYIILWIAMPGSYDLEEPAAAKKMFRDPETKVLAGVSGGIAAYFGIELVIVRILFIIFTFIGGLGLLVYIVMWIVLPEARSITDRVQMKGEPVTLSNIESNIKSGLDIREGQNENVLVKILLFPFRLIALIIAGLARVMGPIGDVLRVAIGIFIALIGISLVFSTVVGLGVVVGLFTFPWPWMLDYNDIAFPIENVQNLIPGWMALAAFVAAIVPGILLVLAGYSIITAQTVITPAVGWALFVMLFASLAALAIGIPQIAYTFKEEGEYRVEKTFDLGGKTAVLKVRQIGMDDFVGANLTLKGHESKEIRLVESFESQGSTRQIAIQNAQMVTYDVVQEDSVLIFDSNIRFKKDAEFRAQRVDLTLYLPYGYPFVMEEDMSRFITQFVNHEHLDGFTWLMTPDGLECVNCPVVEDDGDGAEPWTSAELTGFDELDISGIFDVEILDGDGYEVGLRGSEKEKAKYNVYKSGSTLVLDYDGEKLDLDDLDPDKVHITITMPVLRRLEARGWGTIRMNALDHDDEFELDVSGPIKVRGELQAQDLIVRLNGSAEADLSGTAASLLADIRFASRLRAYDVEVDDAVVEVTGASSAQVNVTGLLEIDEALGSKVDYRGEPREVKRND